MRKRTTAYCTVLLLGALFGCAHDQQGPIIYPIATGSHAFNYSVMEKPHRYIVWSTHPTVTASVTQVLQSNRQTVVERAQLNRAFDEQRIRLTHTSDDETQLLRVGKLIGADQIVFADHTSDKDNRNLYRLMVRVRAVDVETGEIKWNGSAWYPERMVEEESGLFKLAAVAMFRATCMVERGAKWTAYSASGGGCSKK